MTSVEQRLADLEATVERLQHELTRARGAAAASPPPMPSPTTVGRADSGESIAGEQAGLTRRRMLTGAAAAGVLGTVATASAGGGDRVEAADGEAMRLGQLNEAVNVTHLRTSSTGTGLIVSDGGTGGHTTAELVGIAVGGAFSGVMGVAARSSPFVDGYGVVADAFREGSSPGPPGDSARAQLMIFPHGTQPTKSVQQHFAGEVVVDDVTNSLWYCAKTGSPGSWRRIAGQGVKTPSQLANEINAIPRVTLIRPERVYDSRFGDGPLVPGANRKVSVRRGIDIETGNVVTGNLVPAEATGIMFNIAAIGTQVGGFLSVTPGDATEFSAASINWSESGQVLNNGTMSTVTARAVRVWCGGLGGADFTIDVTGYVV